MYTCIYYVCYRYIIGTTAKMIIDTVLSHKFYAPHRMHNMFLSTTSDTFFFVLFFGQLYSTIRQKRSQHVSDQMNTHSLEPLLMSAWTPLPPTHTFPSPAPRPVSPREQARPLYLLYIVPIALSSADSLGIHTHVITNETRRYAVIFFNIFMFFLLLYQV